MAYKFCEWVAGVFRLMTPFNQVQNRQSSDLMKAADATIEYCAREHP